MGHAGRQVKALIGFADIHRKRHPEPDARPDAAQGWRAWPEVVASFAFGQQPRIMRRANGDVAPEADGFHCGTI
jgi:hypothetical protein